MSPVDESRLRARLLSSMRVNQEISQLIDGVESKLDEAMKNLKKIGDQNAQQRLRDDNKFIDALKRQALADGYAVRMAIKAGDEPRSIEALLDQFDASNAQLKAAVEKFSARLDQFLGN